MFPFTSYPPYTLLPLICSIMPRCAPPCPTTPPQDDRVVLLHPLDILLRLVETGRRHGTAAILLVGEAAGFADPVLAAGMMLAHVGARELAYVLAELHTDQSREAWLKSSFDTNQRRRVNQHIRFADFWYSANGQFSDLREQCVKIADESGLKLTPEAAWRWLAQGGFANDFVERANFGTFDVASMKHVMGFVLDKQLDFNIQTWHFDDPW